MPFTIALACAALLLLGTAGAAGAAGAATPQPEAGRLQFVHAAEDAPTFGLELFAPDGQGGLIGMYAAEPGTTVDLVAEGPLTPGRYELGILSSSRTGRTR